MKQAQISATITIPRFEIQYVRNKFLYVRFLNSYCRFFYNGHVWFFSHKYNPLIIVMCLPFEHRTKNIFNINSGKWRGEPESGRASRFFPFETRKLMRIGGNCFNC